PGQGGPNQFSQFLAEHGEGVQHIGFWTPDVRKAVEAAIAAGGRLVSASTDAAGNTSVQLLPEPGGPLPDLTNLRPFTFIGAGPGWRPPRVRRCCRRRSLSPGLARRRLSADRHAATLVINF